MPAPLGPPAAGIVEAPPPAPGVATPRADHDVRDRVTEELAPEVLRRRWLDHAQPAAAEPVTYVAAPPAPRRRGPLRRAVHRMSRVLRERGAADPGDDAAARAATPAGDEAAAASAAPPQSVGRRVAIAVAVLHISVLILALSVVVASAVGAWQPTRATAPEDTAPVATSAALPSTASPAPVTAGVAPAAGAGTAEASSSSVSAPMRLPSRLDLRLYCRADDQPFAVDIDGRDAEVLATGVGRCAGWLLVEAGNVVSWVQPVSASPVVPTDASGVMP